MESHDGVIILPRQDLHNFFIEAAYEERVSIINLGAEMWVRAGADAHKRIRDADDEQKRKLYMLEGRKEGEEAVWTHVRKDLQESTTLRQRYEQLIVENRVLMERLKRLSDGQEEQVSDRLELSVKEATMGMNKLLTQLEVDNARLSARMEQVPIQQKTIMMLEEKLGTVQSKLKEYETVKSSKAIGDEGELEVEELFNKHIEYELLNTSKRGHDADFHILVPMVGGRKTKIMIDSKKYTSSVKKQERDKLMSDVDSDNNVSGGVMISLSSDIATKKHFQIEETAKGKAILYMVLQGMPDIMRVNQINAGIQLMRKCIEMKENDTGMNWLAQYNVFFRQMEVQKAGFESIRKLFNQTLKSYNDQISNFTLVLSEFLPEKSSDSPKSVRDQPIPLQNPVENVHTESQPDGNKRNRVIPDDVSRCAAMKRKGGVRCTNGKATGDFCGKHAEDQSSKVSILAK